MSYTRQFENFVPNRPLDYSRSELSQLNEASLTENDGISASTPAGLLTVYGPPVIVKNAPTGRPLDWNRDNDTIDVGVNSDINNISGITECGASGSQSLKGNNDWGNITYSQPARIFKGVVSATTSIIKTITDIFGVDLATSSGAALAANKMIELEGPSNTQITELPPELTENDVRTSRILLLDALNLATNSLPDSAFNLNAPPPPPPPPPPVETCNPNSPLLTRSSTGGKNCRIT